MSLKNEDNPANLSRRQVFGMQQFDIGTVSGKEIHAL